MKSLGGARLEAVLGDAESQPEIGAAEVEKMNEAGASAVVGAYASAICLDTDAIIPSREMKRVSKHGLAEGLFSAGATWRERTAASLPCSC